MRAILLLSLVFVIACGDKETPENGGGAAKIAGSGGGGGAASAKGAKDAPAEIAALIPSDAHAVLLVESSDRVQEMMSEIAPDERVPQLLRELRQLTGVEPDKLDPFEPMAVAVRMRRGRMPEMAFVLAAKDEQTAAELGGAGVENARGKHFVVRRGEFAKGGGSPLVKGLPNAPIAFRADLAELAKVHKADLEMLISTGSSYAKGVVSRDLPGSELGRAIDDLVGWTRGALAAADLLEVSIDVKSGWIDFQTAYVAKEGSPIALAPSSPSLAGYAQNVPAHFPVALMFAFDLKSHVRTLMQALMTQMPSKDRAAFRKMMDDSKGLLDALGENWMLAAGYPDTLRFVGAVETADPGRYTAAYFGSVKRNKDELSASMGLSFEVEESREVAGQRVHGARIRIDNERLAGQIAGVRARDVGIIVPILFGDQGPRIDLAPGSRRVLFGLGNGAIEDALGASGGSAGLKQVIGHAGGSLGFVIHVELRRLFEDLNKLNAKMRGRMPKLEDGDAIPVSLYGTRHGRRYSLGLYANIAEAVKAFKSFAD